MNKHPKIALALGSGGSRGLAHIGVLKVLEENGIKIDIVTGSSIGALIGGCYANGMTSSALEEMALATDWKLLFGLVDPSLGLGMIGGDKVKKFIADKVGKAHIEDARIPFAAVATDMNTGEGVTFTKGKMVDAIRASISVPLVFKPVKTGTHLLADGGLSFPVPVQAARDLGADIVIAVNLDKHQTRPRSLSNIKHIAEDSLSIIRYHLAMTQMKDADIGITINAGKVYWYEFTNGKNLINLGEAAMREAMPALIKKLDR